MLLHYLAKCRNRKIASFDYCTARLQLVVGLIYSDCYLYLTLVLLNLVVSGVKCSTVTWPQPRRKEVEGFALQQLDCVECKMHWHHVLLNKKIVINVLNST